MGLDGQGVIEGQAWEEPRREKQAGRAFRLALRADAYVGKRRGEPQTAEHAGARSGQVMGVLGHSLPWEELPGRKRCSDASAVLSLQLSKQREVGPQQS